LKVLPDTVQPSGFQPFASLSASGCFYGLFSEKTTPNVYFTAIYAFYSPFWERMMDLVTAHNPTAV